MSTLTDDADEKRRQLLTASTAVAGAAGVAALAWPFLASWQPSARALAAGAPVVVDISMIDPGTQITVEWRGKPVWVLRRTREMLDRLPELESQLRDPESNVDSQQPEYARNIHRSILPEYLVAVGLCTHLGCVPSFSPNPASVDLGPAWAGGYFCPCHGSRFDLAGRVYSGVPAPTNLLIPPYRYLDEQTIEIGRNVVSA